MSGEQSQPAGMELPIAPHQKNRALNDALKAMRFKIFVMSGKGGVGKSSVTVNLGAALAEMGFKVGIMDVDVHGPSVPRLLGLPDGAVSGVSGGKIVPMRVSDRLAVISMDVLMPDRDSAIIWRGPKKAGAIQQFVSDVDWGELDFFIIDSPPGTGDEHLTILRLVPDALCLMVTTPQEIALADVRKAMSFLRELKAKVLGVVENMSGLSCPHCGGNIDIFKTGGGLELARKYQVPFLGAIPLDPKAAHAADQGRPAVLMDEAGAAKSAFFALAENVKNACLNMDKK